MLLICTAAGLVHGIKACVAEWNYYAGRYGNDAHDFDAKLARFRRAHRWYRFNHHLCAYIAETSFYTSGETDNAEARRRLQLAETWCDTGLFLNPYRSDLNTLKARLLALTHPAKAEAFWSNYLEWEFWNPYNHLLMLEFAALNSNIETALEHLEWIRRANRQDYVREGEEIISTAWNEALQVPASATSRD